MPVAFLSKALPKDWVKWPINEKEAYAIYYTLTKFEYLLGGRFFTLRTDHKNLTYFNSDSNKKIYHWKLAIQSFDFQIEHIPGEENIAADPLSRLCTVTKEVQDIVCAMHNGASFATIALLEKIPEEAFLQIKAVHSSINGHLGKRKTLAKLKAMGCSWPDMENHVKQFKSQCPICQKIDERDGKITAPLFTLSALEPMEKISCDSMGPFPEDSEGNKYILVVIDTFSRWIELYALKTLEATEAAKKLLMHFGRYGIANDVSEIISDNGSQFVNHTVDEVLKLIGVKHVTSLAYSKQETGIVERSNKEVLRHLRAIINEFKADGRWSDYLPLVQRIFNAQMIESTGVSPATVLFGNALHLDRHVFKQMRDPDFVYGDLSKYSEQLVAAQAKIIELAQHNQIHRNAEHMAKDSKTPTVFPVGSLVISKYHKVLGKAKPPTKLHLYRYGPLKVVSFDSQGRYVLTNTATGKEEKKHLTDLKAYEDDSDHYDAEAVAEVDQHVWRIDTILSHSGNIKKVSSLKFKVRWAGDVTPKESTEPWKNLRLTEQMHAYLRSKKLDRLIPKIIQTDDDMDI